MTANVVPLENSALRLARYLKEFVGLRRTTVYDVAKYDSVLWFKVPHDRSQPGVDADSNPALIQVIQRHAARSGLPECSLDRRLRCRSHGGRIPP